MSLPEIQKPENDVFSRQLDEPKPRKRSRGRRFLKGLGVTTLVLAIGGAVVANFTQFGQETTDLIQKHGKEIVTGGLNPDLIFDHNGQHVNILLIGRDVNWKPGKVLDPTE